MCPLKSTLFFLTSRNTSFDSNPQMSITPDSLFLGFWESVSSPTGIEKISFIAGSVADKFGEAATTEHQDTHGAHGDSQSDNTPAKIIGTGEVLLLHNAD
jgi:hypothetical protein